MAGSSKDQPEQKTNGINYKTERNFLSVFLLKNALQSRSAFVIFLLCR